MVHLSSFQSSLASQLQQQVQQTQQSIMTQSLHATCSPPPPSVVNNSSAHLNGTNSGNINKTAITFQQQNAACHPPKPPERSCSFKDVDNLQQQQQLQSQQQQQAESQALKSSPTSNPNSLTQQQSKRQRSLTTKDSASFCLKDLRTNLNPVNEPDPQIQQQQQQTQNSTTSHKNLRPKSRLFPGTANATSFLDNLDENNQQAASIKITSMKLNDSNTTSSPVSQAANVGENMHAIITGKAHPNLSFNKFGTLPSANKIAAAQTENVKAACVDDIPEFQRVFGHLRKVATTTTATATKANPSPGNEPAVSNLADTRYITTA